MLQIQCHMLGLGTNEHVSGEPSKVPIRPPFLQEIAGLPREERGVFQFIKMAE